MNNDSSVQSIKVDVFDIKLHAVNNTDLLDEKAVKTSDKWPYILLRTKQTGNCFQLVPLHNNFTESVFRSMLLLR